MKNRAKTFFAITGMATLLFACQSSNDSKDTTQNTATDTTSSSTTVTEQAPPPLMKTDPEMPNCAQSSPPILDTSKIENMLIKEGKITTEMDQKQRQKIVNDYINSKRNAYKMCKPKGK
ncbi:hypothetical protein [Aliikangiella maris]|uniref:Lipoprotein n=2 Tax=Aliikangiella maris TaxID=3162458 RepID=A0ABV3MK96_9GAMM